MKVALHRRRRSTDRWFVSFPAFPAVVMLPFVALHGYQFNDTCFGVFLGALAIALFYRLLRSLRGEGRAAAQPRGDAAAGAACSASERCSSAAPSGARSGSWPRCWAWSSPASTCAAAVGARPPLLAGLLLVDGDAHPDAAALHRRSSSCSRCCAPDPPERLEQLRPRCGSPRACAAASCCASPPAPRRWRSCARRLQRRSASASPGEFGHRFLYNNRVNADIDTLRALQPALPGAEPRGGVPQAARGSSSRPFRLGYDPRGLSLLLTLPLAGAPGLPEDAAAAALAACGSPWRSARCRASSTRTPATCSSASGSASTTRPISSCCSASPAGRFRSRGGAGADRRVGAGEHLGGAGFPGLHRAGAPALSTGVDFIAGGSHRAEWRGGDRTPRRWHTREDSGLVLDRQLAWFHDGERIAHPRTSSRPSTPAWSRPTTGGSSSTSGTTGPTSRWRDAAYG